MKTVFFGKTNIAILISMTNGTRIAPKTYEKWKRLKSEPPYPDRRPPDCNSKIFSRSAKNGSRGTKLAVSA